MDSAPCMGNKARCPTDSSRHVRIAESCSEQYCVFSLSKAFARACIPAFRQQRKKKKTRGKPQHDCPPAPFASWVRHCIDRRNRTAHRSGINRFIADLHPLGEITCLSRKFYCIVDQCRNRRRDRHARRGRLRRSVFLSVGGVGLSGCFHHRTDFCRCCARKPFRQDVLPRSLWSNPAAGNLGCPCHKKCRRFNFAIDFAGSTRLMKSRWIALSSVFLSAVNNSQPCASISNWRPPSTPLKPLGIPEQASRQ